MRPNPLIATLITASCPLSIKEILGSQIDHKTLRIRVQ
jgi:hypothetical protein